MYEVIYAKTYKINADGTRSMFVIISTDDEPSTLPQTGADVGMQADEVFAPLSMLVVHTGNKIYIADNDGHFNPWE